MAKNLKNKQLEFDKFAFQAAQYKFQCPSKCASHNLLQRLLKKLGEHHILALLVEPKKLEQPDARTEKIFQCQDSHKLAAPPQPVKRQSVTNGFNIPKKPRTSFPQSLPKISNTNFSFSNSRPQNGKSIASAFGSRFNGISSAPNVRQVPPNNALSNGSSPSTSIPCLLAQERPQLISQGRSETENRPNECNLRLRKKGNCCYFEKEGSMTSVPEIPMGIRNRYESGQRETGISKITFDVTKQKSDFQLSLRIHRYGKKLFNNFGMAFRDINKPNWRLTAPNKMPDDKVITVQMPFNASLAKMAVFCVWFSRTGNPEVMCAPIVINAYHEVSMNFTATFEPDCVEID